MAETLLSPGVLTRENDQSQITSGPISVGAAIVGPTVKGPVQIPTLVTTYSDYKNKFGAAFVSGGVTLEYLTSIAAYNYFQQGGESLLVARVVSGSTAAYTPAVTTQITNLGGTGASFVLETLSEGVIMNNNGPLLSGGALASGSVDNVRWEITNVNTGSGTFNMIIRQGNDTQNQKLVVETWLNLSTSLANFNIFSLCEIVLAGFNERQTFLMSKLSALHLSNIQNQSKFAEL